MQVNELFKQSNTILLDGGMGTMLQAAGLKLGARPAVKWYHYALLFDDTLKNKTYFFVFLAVLFVFSIVCSIVKGKGDQL